MYCLCLCVTETPNGMERSLVITKEFGILSFAGATEVRVIGVHPNQDAAVTRRNQIIAEINRARAAGHEVALPLLRRYHFVVAIVPADADLDLDYTVIYDEQPWEVPVESHFILLYAGNSAEEAEVAQAYADQGVHRAYTQTLEDSTRVVAAHVAHALMDDN